MSANKKTECKALPLSDAMQILLDSYDDDIDNYNELADHAARIESENTFLKLQLSNVTGRLDEVISQNEQLTSLREQEKAASSQLDSQLVQITDNAHKHMAMLEQAKRERAQTLLKFNDLDEQVKAFKEIANTPKKIREKVKGYQERIAELMAAVKKSKSDIKTVSREKEILLNAKKLLEREIQEIEFNRFYSNKGENLAVYPQMFEVINGTNKEKQVPIWYMTDKGIGALYTLNEDNEPVRFETPKGGIKPTKETMQIIGTLLRKFKKNGNLVLADDLKAYGMTN